METQQGQINATKYVASSVVEYMPGIPAFPTIGNHGEVITYKYPIRNGLPYMEVTVAQKVKVIYHFLVHNSFV